MSLFAVTSTSSALTDQGADANSVVAITDLLSATTLPNAESFSTIAASNCATVYRGVTETPVPEPASLSLLGLGIAGLLAVARRRAGARGLQNRKTDDQSERHGALPTG